MAIGLVMPIEAAVIVVKHAGGGVVRYALGVLLGFALGVLIVRLNCQIGRSVWLRSKNYSHKAKNRIALGLFVLHVVLIIAGSGLALLLVHYVD